MNVWTTGLCKSTSGFWCDVGAPNEPKQATSIAPSPGLHNEERAAQKAFDIIVVFPRNIAVSNEIPLAAARLFVVHFARTLQEIPPMNNPVRIAVIVGFLAILGVGVWKSTSTPEATPQVAGGPNPASTAATQPVAKTQTVKLLTGSAKFGFLKDPKMEELLAAKGIRLELAKTADFATDVTKQKDFDAVWPAGANAASEFAAAWKSPNTYPVFSTPLVIASWKQLMPVLQANGLAKAEANHGLFYLNKALPLMLNGKRWNQLKDNTVFEVNKGFLVNTPDVRKSNTGMLYLGALAYISNNEDVPSTVAMGEALAEKLSSVMTRQGFQEGTLAGPFEDYLGQGLGKAPLVLIYESQFVEAKRDSKLRDTSMLLYPQPGLVLKHVLVARTDAGKALGELLANDPEIQRLAAQYGFRTNSPAIFADAMSGYGLDAPELINLAEPPSTAVLDAMSRVIVRKLEGN